VKKFSVGFLRLVYVVAATLFPYLVIAFLIIAPVTETCHFSTAKTRIVFYFLDS